MKTQIILFVSIIFSIKCFTQIKYERGYFITNSGEKNYCLIENMDWKNNPTKFLYKRTENSPIIEQTIEDISEFGITNEYVFKRFKVAIDRSSDAQEFLSANKDPILKNETLFLKELVVGKAILYLFEEADFIRYFFSVDSSDVKQLIFKSYLDGDNTIKQNKTYKEQLWQYLRNPKISMRDIENTKYTTDDLSIVFKTYNLATDTIHKLVDISTKKNNKDLFKLNLRPGISNSNLSLNNLYYDFSIEKRLNNFRFGVEAEFILPYNRNKWACIIEPTYQYYKANFVDNYKRVDVFLKTLEIPIGFRHSFFINDASKIFINGSFVLNLNLGSSIKYNDQEFVTMTHTFSSFHYGVGYSFKKKYSAELRFNKISGIIGNSVEWASEYSNMSFILGYSIF